MAEVWEWVRATFWNEWFWLPPHLDWTDLVNKNDGIYRAQLSDMVVVLPLAVLLLVLRAVFERFVAAPIGKYYGLKEEKKKEAPHNPYLEKIYTKNKTPDKKSFESISKQTDLSVRQVERWFRIRRMQNRTIVLYRFTESCWRCLFYLVIFGLGVYWLWDKCWLWNTVHCWQGFPHHHVTNDIYWYYAIEGAFYISLLITQFKDVKRKDFYEQTLHHFLTLSLMFMSWVQNLVRIGTLILVIHDAVDSWLEAAKLTKYLKWNKTCDVIFFIFFLVWIITRMVLFPLKLIYTVMFESTPITGMCSVYFVYNILLLGLQMLHIFWFVIIARVVYKALKKGNVQKDDRSSSDEDISDTDSNGSKPDHVANGSSMGKNFIANGVIDQSGVIPRPDTNQNKLQSRH